jgi:hypothetical protein
MRRDGLTTPETRPQDGQASVYEGTVSRVASADVFVVLPGYMPHREQGPAPYTGATTPSVGDKVWCAIDDSGEAIIVCWVA